MELADDVSGYGTGLPKDAVPGEDLVIISDDVVRTQGSQLAQHRLRGISRLVHERRAVASARLSGGFDTLLTACLEALRQKASQAGESTHRIAEIDLLASQSIKVGRLAGFSPALSDRQVSERDKTLKMSMRDRSVHAGGFGSIVNRPFALVHIKVEQDPPTGPILKRADRTVDLAYLVLAHSASLSARVGGETDRPTHALLSRHAMEPEVWQSVSKKGRSGSRHGTVPPRLAREAPSKKRSGGGRGIRTPEGLHLSGFQDRSFQFAGVRQRSPCIQTAERSSAVVR
jgi:hypothetical protein